MPVTYEQALKEILKHTLTLPVEKIAIEESVGRILKEDIYSRIEMPPFDKSAMDGYVVNSLDVRNVPVQLRCLGIIQAGDRFVKTVHRGECVKIMTGAPLPKNTDSVVMVEDSRKVSEYIEILRSVKEGENVCFQGEDLKCGQRLIEKGTKISSSHVAIFATVGRRFVKTVARPQVSILNTGGEIVPLGARLGRNKIYNSNGPMLCAFLKSDGIKPQLLGIARDNAADLKKAIKKGLETDILLISGGVSMGDYDLIPGVLRDIKVRQIFHKVNIKPGKPLFFALKNKTVIFGIPGNPVSNFLTYLIFIRPAIHKMMGYKNCEPQFREGILETGFHTKAGRRHFVLVKISEKAGCYYLLPIDSHGSADTFSLSKSDGFMMVSENATIIRSGSKIPFITWK